MQSRLLLFLSAGAVVFASSVPEVWNNKEFADWTTDDAQQILTTSPWAKERQMPISQRPGVVYVDPNGSASSPSTAELGNPANTTGGPNVSTTAAAGAGSSNRTGPLSSAPTPAIVTAPVGAPAAQPLMKVIWASALPVRLAVLKLRSGTTPATSEQLANALKDRPHYVIAVVGLPAPESLAAARALASTAFLSARGRPPLAAADSDYRRVGDSDVYFFRFAKASLPLADTDGEVEFKLAAGRMKLSQKFQLALMRYRGQLAL